jgi:hypothetical protein
VQWKDFLCGSAEEAERRVKAQIAIGVSPLATSKYGKTLLHAAAIANNLPVARLAIASGVAIDQRAYPNGKRYQKRTLGWTALFYAVRNSTIDVTRFLLDNGAAEVRSVQGETPIEAALSARAEDSFWLLIEYGFSDMDKVNKDYSKLSADTRHSIHRNIPPSIISSQFAWTKMPVELIGFLEKFLQSALGVTVNQTEYTEFCSRCSSGLKSCDDKIREVWRERNERISMWKPFSESFDYGYLRRCQICRTSLTKTRSQSPGSLLNVPTMILPSDTPAFSFVQKRNFEGKVPTLREVTSF